MQIESVLPFISIGLAIAGYVFGQKQGVAKEGRERGTLLTDLDYIKRDLAEIKTNVKEINIAEIKADMKQLQQRVNALEETQRLLIRNKIDE